MFERSAAALDFKDKYEENAQQELATGALSLETWIVLQRCWSEKTFGPRYQRGPLGPAKHLKKELDQEVLPMLEDLQRRQESATEYELRQSDLPEEIIDLIFLVFDIAWRAGMSIMDIRKTLTAKLVKNRQRKWPAGVSGTEAVEHDRTEDKK